MGLNNNRDSVQLKNHVTWECDNSEVNGVVGMKIETFIQKVTFETFKDKISNYVVSSYKDSEDAKSIFKKLEDPIAAMTIKHKPGSLANTVDQTEKDIQRERIKKFVSREFMMRTNMEKLYGFFMGSVQLSITSYYQYNEQI